MLQKCCMKTKKRGSYPKLWVECRKDMHYARERSSNRFRLTRSLHLATNNVPSLNHRCISQLQHRARVHLQPNQVQEGVVIRLVECVREGTINRASPCPNLQAPGPPTQRPTQGPSKISKITCLYQIATSVWPRIEHQVSTDTTMLPLPEDGIPDDAKPQKCLE